MVTEIYDFRFTIDDFFVQSRHGAILYDFRLTIFLKWRANSLTGLKTDSQTD